MNTEPEDERVVRVRRTRQVLAGTDVQPPDDGPGYGDTVNQVQRTYLIAVAAIFAVAVLVFVIWGMGIASVLFFILALALLAGWVVF